MAILHSKFIENFVSELKSSKNLRWFAVGLTFVHLLTALFWQQQGAFEILTNASQRICWPIFPECGGYFNFSSSFSAGVLSFYVVLFFVTLYFYFKNLKIFWFLLLLLEIVKLGVQFVDYRFMGNYHFMPHILTFMFLFFGNRKTTARIWLVTFYMGAALLKVNQEWLSGSSLAWKIPFGNIKLLPILALAALLIEINAPILLLIEKKWARNLGLAGLVLFHLVSFYWVGFFYPLVMLSLLSVFVLTDDDDIRIKLGEKNKSNFVVGAIWSLFFINQIYRVYDYRHTATDGYKRLASLNMFDAYTTCIGFYLIKDGTLTTHVPFPNQGFAVRVRCDNIIFDSYLNKLCKANDKTISAYLSVRLQSDSGWENSFSKEDACAKKL